MKKFLTILCLVPTFTFAAEFNSMATKPLVLELKKYVSASGRTEIRYIHERPRIMIRLATNSKEVLSFLRSMTDSELTKLNCDAEFDMTFDASGTQYIHINAIRACLDEDGALAAHSIGLSPLTDAQIASSARLIEDKTRPETSNVASNVNDSKGKKEVEENPKAGFMSSKLKPKSSFQK